MMGVRRRSDQQQQQQEYQEQQQQQPLLVMVVGQGVRAAHLVGSPLQEPCRSDNVSSSRQSPAAAQRPPGLLQPPGRPRLLTQTWTTHLTARMTHPPMTHLSQMTRCPLL
jgi:hypothetical protein